MNVEDSTLAVVRALERMGIRHYVGGSMASSLHGEPRETNDADLVAVLTLSDCARLQKELGDRFYVDPEDFKHAVLNERPDECQTPSQRPVAQDSIRINVSTRAVGELRTCLAPTRVSFEKRHAIST